MLANTKRITGGREAYQAGVTAGRACRKANSRSSTGESNPHPPESALGRLWGCGHYDGYWGVAPDYDHVLNKCLPMFAETE